MKKKVDNQKDQMRSEYDFSGGVRGKHFQKIKDGHTTVINKADGSTVIVETRLIALEPDVQEYFPDAKSANRALRGLIDLFPENAK